MATHNCPHGHKFIEHPTCYEKYLHGKIPPEKIGFFDIETSNLNASFGLILSFAVKERGGKVISSVITPEELGTPAQDKRITMEAIEAMDKFDRIVGFYSRKFDIPYIRTRAMAHNVRFFEFREKKHTDIYWWARFKMKMHSNKLGVVAPFLGIEAKNHQLEGPIWTRALAGHKPSLKYILTHNIEDVHSTEALFERLLPFNQLTNTCM